MRTFGEFFDAVSDWANGESLCIEATIFMEKWKEHVNPLDWERVRALEMDDDVFYDFVEDMIENYHLRLQGISHLAVHLSLTKERAQEFFKIVALKGRECGLEVDEERLKL